MKNTSIRKVVKEDLIHLKDVLNTLDLFPAEMTRYTDYIKSSKPADPGSPVLVPGEPETAMRAKRNAEGVPLPDDTWTAIANAAHHVGLGDNRIKAALG